MVKLFVEGGGDGKALRTQCRQGISEFLKKAGLAGSMPRTVASGSRQQAFEDFCTAVIAGEQALLLLDSEAPVAVEHEAQALQTCRPWAHLKQRDGWSAPDGATDADCHLMVECMENWFLADRESLQRFFGQGFRSNALPDASQAVESIGKSQLFKALAAATSSCKTKAPYGKGEHSFKLLAAIDPIKVMAASPWAHRFVTEAKQRMNR